jgi:hypothetical protein
MTVDSKRKFLAARGGEVAQLAVGVNDGAFVGGDGVGSVLEGGADVVDGGLAIFHVERCGFEEDVGLGGGEPGADVVDVSGLAGERGRIRCWHFAGKSARATLVRVDSGRVGNPAQAAGGDSGDAAGDAVAIAEFLRAVFEEADERPVDIAEAEEAEVVGGDGFLAPGLSPIDFTNGDAALKRRSSTLPRPLFRTVARARWPPGRPSFVETLLATSRQCSARPPARDVASYVSDCRKNYPITVVCSGLIL